MDKLPSALFIVDPRKRELLLRKQRNSVFRLLQLLIPTVILMKLTM